MTDPIDPGGVQARVNEMHETLAKVNQSLGLPVRSRGGEPVPTDSIVAFLTERLNDDERIARAALHEYGEWSWHDGEEADRIIGEPLRDERTGHYAVETFPERGGSVCIALAYDHLDNAVHIARHDPRRVLADVEAKRAILTLHGRPHECAGFYDNGSRVNESSWCVAAEDCDTLLALARAHRDHPEFDPSWAS